MGSTQDSLTGITSQAERQARENAETITDITRHLAAHAVWRQCNRHDCTVATGISTTCAHPNHRRDVDYFRTCLAALGLEDAVTATDAISATDLLAAIGNLDTSISDLREGAIKL